MSVQDEITKAIGAHGMWKARLRTMIDTGVVEIPVEKIGADNQCDFGKWLYGTTLDAKEKQSDRYKTVIDLHAKFHKEAAKVASLVIAGKGTDAAKALENGTPFAAISTTLTTKMMDWKKEA